MTVMIITTLPCDSQQYYTDMPCHDDSQQCLLVNSIALQYILYVIHIWSNDQE